MSVTQSTRDLARRCNDFLVGPGASRKEDLVTYAVAAVGSVAVGIMFAGADEFRWWKLIILCIVAFDFFGGATANATNAARKWWHRPGVKPSNALVFVAFHVHPVLVGLLFEGFPVALGIVAYVITFVAALISLLVPPEVMRPTAYGLCCLCVLVTSVLPGVAGYLGWLLPVMYMKLLLSHLLPDGSATADRLSGVRSGPEHR